jgi:hypothetical protein
MAGGAAEIEVGDRRRVRGPGHEQPAADHLIRVDQAVREIAVRRALHGGEVVRREDRTLHDAVA